MKPFDDVLEICASGKNSQLRSKIRIPCCWIKVSDPAGKIVFKKIEKEFTNTTISFCTFREKIEKKPEKVCSTHEEKTNLTMSVYRNFLKKEHCKIS